MHLLIDWLSILEGAGYYAECTMCGICGVVQVEGELRTVVPPEVLDSMTDSMVHRGPNDRGTYQRPGIALGVRRLSIVDVAGGHQPFLSEDGAVAAIQNGELYNHEEVRAELVRNGHRLRTRCDTEILPHLYEDVGDRVPEHVRGKFGLAVWDGRRRRAVIARDRLGVKPLYYARCGDLLVFASELKSLLASGLIDGTLDYEAIDAYLTFGFFPGPQTPLAGVAKLRPGHRLIVGDGTRPCGGVLALPAPGPPNGNDHGRARGRAARRTRGIGAAQADERRAIGGDAERRDRLEPDRRPDGASHERPGQDVFSRLRGGRSERARGRP